MTQEKNPFDWLLYADATFAGLAVLIPLPPIDLLTEWYFRRRMLRTIARRNGVELRSEVTSALQREGCCAGCFMWPLTLTFLILKRLSRKILYFLTIKEASDMLSFYWHRAYLLNHMFAAGHLNDGDSAAVAREALDETLQEAVTSPLGKVASQVIQNSRHVWRTLRRIRRDNEEDDVVAESRSLMSDQWAESASYLEGLAVRYQARFEKLQLDNVITLHDKEAKPLRYEPLHEGEEDNERSKEGDSGLEAEKTQAENGPRQRLDTRKLAAGTTKKEEAKPRTADDRQDEDPQGE